MGRKIKLWFYRFFVISEKKAKKLGLLHYRNIFGDEINELKCRSLWLDENAHSYRVKTMKKN